MAEVTKNKSNRAGDTGKVNVTCRNKPDLQLIANLLYQLNKNDITAY